MAIDRTDDGIEVAWWSSSVPVEQLDAALSRDYNLILRYAESLLVGEKGTPLIGCARSLRHSDDTSLPK
jgi:hypothetical protein